MPTPAGKVIGERVRALPPLWDIKRVQGMQKPNRHPGRWLACAAAGSALVSSAFAGTFTANFNDNQVPPGTALYGDTGEGNAGVIEEGVLKLTKAVGNMQGGFIIEDLDGGAVVSAFTASFKLLIGGGSGADGFSFNFAPDLPDGGMSEEGSGTGLTVAFDVYNNGGGEAPAIDLKNGGTIVASTLGVGSLIRQNRFIDVLLEVRNDGTLNLTVDNSPVYRNFYGAFTPTSGRFGFGARTGGSADNHWVDDIQITTSTGPVTQPAHPLVVSNAPPALGAPAEAVISLEVRDFTTQLRTDTVQLLVNGKAVTPVVAKEGDLTRISYDPPGLFPSESVNNYTLIFTDSGGTVNTNEYPFTVRRYKNVVLPAPLHFQNFDGVEEGGFPTGWVQTNATVSLDGSIDFDNPNSDAYLGWTVIDRTRLDGNPFNARRLNVAEGYVNGVLVTNLVDGKLAYAESDNRSGSQIQMLFSPDYDLTGKTDVHVSFHSIYEQNQDSLGAVEYSIDGGLTWLPVVYMIDEADIFRDAGGNIDVMLTLTNTVACCGDQPYQIDPDSGEPVGGGYFGYFIGVDQSRWPTLGPYISGRINDDPVESKRVELYRLPMADNQARVRFRFTQAGTGSWYFGIDDFGLYSIPAPSIRDYSVGLNFGADEVSGNNAGTVTATDVAGVTGVAQAHWNNLTLLSGSASALVADNQGTAEPTTLSVNWSSANTWANTGRGEENNAFTGPDKALLTGYLDTTGASTTTVKIASIPSKLVDQGYDVYVYALGGVAGRGGSYRILDGATGKVLRDSIRAQSSSNNTAYVEVPTNLGSTANGAANLVFGSGNYLVFRGLTASSITVEARTAAAGGGVGFSGTPRAPINAVQLVTPSSGSLAGDVSMPGDSVATTSPTSRSPDAERVANAIDNNLLTKFLDFNDADANPPFTGPVGLTVATTAGASVVTGLALTSANDAPERDPASYKLEGSNDGTTFTLISEGSVPTFAKRFLRQEIPFANSTPYTVYRLTIPTVANATTANSMQVAEVEFLGTVVAPRITALTRNANGSLTLEWKGGGTLQAAPAVNGPWADVPGATSPYTLNPTEQATFGRIRK